MAGRRFTRREALRLGAVVGGATFIGAGALPAAAAELDESTIRRGTVVGTASDGKTRVLGEDAAFTRAHAGAGLGAAPGHCQLRLA